MKIVQSSPGRNGRSGRTCIFRVQEFKLQRVVATVHTTVQTLLPIGITTVHTTVQTLLPIGGTIQPNLLMVGS